jgi:two-component system, chemotaxis family, CheB/CheR fusion protein
MSDNSETGSDVEVLLDYLRRNRGFDFTGYKRTSLTRRIDKRMQAVGISSYLDYVDYLEVVPEEFTHLFNTILINVTGFFRDPPAWEFVAEEVLPDILAARRPGEPLRIWSAGCASGQEAYTLAMLCGEVLGLDGFRERVKIYATDVDDEALNQARSARYTAKEVEGVPADMLQRYFERNGQGHFVFSKDLRRSVIFGRHDLIQDAPISRIDLLVCRNTLMYFNSEIQAHILGRLAFALREGGYLFLGRAEMLLAHSSLFSAVDLKRRVFRQVPQPGLRERLMALSESGNPNPRPQASRAERTREAALDAGREAQLVVDGGGYLVMANAKARSLFDLSSGDVGKLFQDLEVSYRPVELRSKIQQAYIDRQPSTVYETEWPSGMGEVAYLEVQIVPLVDSNQSPLGASISFTDVTRSKRFQQELEHTNRELEDAYAELQSTNEELETTNEELQSTVEELETTNEELQSTNEELETMNEEMQSTNEELQTINDELSQRTTDLNQVNAFLESIWESLGGAVTVLDEELRVRVWNQRAEDLWGVRQDEIQGQHFLNLDIGLPVGELVPTLRSSLNGDGEKRAVRVEAINRRGKPIEVLVTSSPLLGSQKEIRGVILITHEAVGQST